MANEGAAKTDSKVIAISNRKGGSGKTTTSVNLAAALAHKGERVLLLDADPQGHSSLSLGKAVRGEDVDLYSLLSGKASLAQVTRNTYLKRLFIVPGGMRLAIFEKKHAANGDMRMVLATAMREARKLYDYVLIDTPPTLNLMTISALLASTDVLVPMQAHFLAMEGLAEMVKLIRKINQIYKSELKLMGVVPTFFQPHARLSSEIISAIKGALGQAIIMHPVRANIALAEAPSHGQTIFQYNLKSNGAHDYLTLANQIEALQ